MTWKPLPERPDPAKGPRRLSESLNRVTRDIGGPDAAVLSTIFGRWEEIVGAHVAAHSWPLGLSDGALVIGVDQPGWASQLTYLENDVKRRIFEVSGSDAVRRVRVTVRPR